MAMNETVESAAKRLCAWKECQGYEHKGLHAYADCDGRVVFYRVRMKHPVSTDKYMPPLYLNGNGWELKEPPAIAEKKMLYGLDLLKQRPTDPVWFVEGEGKADALRKLGLVATTAGGANSHEKVDLEPLRARVVRLWADKNKPGRDHMNAIALKLMDLDCTCVLAVNIDALDIPEGQDCLDWLARHPQATAADVEQLLAESASEPLAEVEAFVRRFVAYPTEHACVAHTLWLAHTHLMAAWESTPRIAFLSPEPGSGKSRALEVSELLVPNPVQAVNVTPAYLFRKVAADVGTATILYDECDTLFSQRASEKSEEIRGLLNAGHRRHGVAGRCVVRGNQVTTEELPAYAAVAMAGLGGLPDTILSRSIVVRMRRRAPSEYVEPFRQRIHAAPGHAIRDRLAMWIKSVAKHLTGAWPVMPKGIEDRNADVWEALLAIADTAGGAWPARARAAALALVDEASESSPSLGVHLLTDMQQVFAERNAIATNDILKALCALEEAPWSDLRGKPLTTNGLARLLKPYGIKSTQMWLHGQNVRGYMQSDFRDAWVRYLGPPAKEDARAARGANAEAAKAKSTSDLVHLAVLAPSHAVDPSNMNSYINNSETATSVNGKTVSHYIAGLADCDPNSEAAVDMWVEIENAGLSEQVDAEMGQANK